MGEASEPDSAFELVRELKPDILVTDVSMGSDKNGLLLAERIEGAGLECAVLVLTMHAEQEYLRQAMERGARGYSNSAIAETLGISVKTVESQKSKVMTKLGLHSKPELFDYAAAHGLISL